MMKFLEKLRSLPESQKIIVFFVVMGVAALVAGFIGMRFIIKDLSKIGDLGKSVRLPTIEIPQELKNLGAPKDETADWQTYTNAAQGYEIKYPPNAKTQEGQAPNILSGEGMLTIRRFDDLDEELALVKEILADTENIKDAAEGQTSIGGFEAKEFFYKNGPFWHVTLYMPQKNINIFVQASRPESLEIFKTMVSTFKFIN